MRSHTRTPLATVVTTRRMTHCGPAEFGSEAAPTSSHLRDGGRAVLDSNCLRLLDLRVGSKVDVGGGVVPVATLIPTSPSRPPKGCFWEAVCGRWTRTAP